MKFKTIFRKNIFDLNEIAELRSFLKKKSNLCNIDIDISKFEQNDYLPKHMFSKKLLDFLKENLQDELFFIQNFVIQKNNRTFNKEKYHKDSGKAHQSDILSKKENIYGKIGIPLQDNIKDVGGGIDYLKPMFLDNFKDKNQIINKIRALYYILQDKFTDTQLYSKAGDVIYFSALLSHRTTLTNKLKVNSIDDKYVIYFQLTNLNTIKDVLKITRNKKNISSEDINKELITKDFNGNKIKILNNNLSQEVGNYIGL